MNKVVLSCIIGSASAVVGAVAGYFVASKYLDDKYSAIYEERLNEELRKIREAHMAAEERRNKDSVSISRKDLEELNISVENGEPLKVSGVEYHKCSQKDSDSDSDVEYDENGEPIDESEVADEYWMDTPDFWDGKPATVISLEEYRDLPSYFDRVTYHYYVEDDTLVDDGDTIVDDIFRLVGDALTKFGPEAAALSDGDVDAVYVINGQLSLAIEVVQLHQAYSSYLGIL